MNTDLVKSTLKLYSSAIKESALCFKRNLMLISLIVVLQLYVMPLSRSLFTSLGSFSGSRGFLIITVVIGEIIQLLFLSLIFKWLAEAINYKKVLRLKDFKSKKILKHFFSIDLELFFNIISINFIIWIATMVLRPVLAGGNGVFLELLLLTIPFNVISEVLILRNYQSLQIFSKAWEFVVENFVEWFLFLFLISLPIILFNYNLHSVRLGGIVGYSSYSMLHSSLVIPLGKDILSPAGSIGANLSIALLSLFGGKGSLVSGSMSGFFVVSLGIIFSTFIAIVRLNLYELLDSNPRRKRAFKSKFS